MINKLVSLPNVELAPINVQHFGNVDRYQVTNLDDSAYLLVDDVKKVVGFEWIFRDSIREKFNLLPSNNNPLGLVSDTKLVSAIEIDYSNNVEEGFNKVVRLLNSIQEVAVNLGKTTNSPGSNKMIAIDVFKAKSNMTYLGSIGGKESFKFSRLQGEAILSVSDTQIEFSWVLPEGVSIDLEEGSEFSLEGDTVVMEPRRIERDSEGVSEYIYSRIMQIGNDVAEVTIPAGDTELGKVHRYLKDNLKLEPINSGNGSTSYKVNVEGEAYFKFTPNKDLYFYWRLPEDKKNLDVEVRKLPVSLLKFQSIGTLGATNLFSDYESSAAIDNINKVLEDVKLFANTYSLSRKQAKPTLDDDKHPFPTVTEFLVSRGLVPKVSAKSVQYSYDLDNCDLFIKVMKSKVTVAFSSANTNLLERIDIGLLSEYGYKWDGEYFVKSRPVRNNLDRVVKSMLDDMYDIADFVNEGNNLRNAFITVAQLNYACDLVEDTSEKVVEKYTTTEGEEFFFTYNEVRGTLSMEHTPKGEVAKNYLASKNIVGTLRRNIQIASERNIHKLFGMFDEYLDGLRSLENKMEEQTSVEGNISLVGDKLVVNAGKEQIVKDAGNELIAYCTEHYYNPYDILENISKYEDELSSDLVELLHMINMMLEDSYNADTIIVNQYQKIVDYEEASKPEEEFGYDNKEEESMNSEKFPFLGTQDYLKSLGYEVSRSGSKIYCTYPTDYSSEEEVGLTISSKEVEAYAGARANSTFAMIAEELFELGYKQNGNYMKKKYRLADSSIETIIDNVTAELATVLRYMSEEYVKRNSLEEPTPEEPVAPVENPNQQKPHSFTMYGEVDELIERGLVDADELLRLIADACGMPLMKEFELRFSTTCTQAEAIMIAKSAQDIIPGESGIRATDRTNYKDVYDSGLVNNPRELVAKAQSDRLVIEDEEELEYLGEIIEDDVIYALSDFITEKGLSRDTIDDSYVHSANEIETDIGRFEYVLEVDATNTKFYVEEPTGNFPTDLALLLAPLGFTTRGKHKVEISAPTSMSIVDTLYEIFDKMIEIIKKYGYDAYYDKHYYDDVDENPFADTVFSDEMEELEDEDGDVSETEAYLLQKGFLRQGTGTNNYYVKEDYLGKYEITINILDSKVTCTIIGSDLLDAEELAAGYYRFRMSTPTEAGKEVKATNEDAKLIAAKGLVSESMEICNLAHEIVDAGDEAKSESDLKTIDMKVHRVADPEEKAQLNRIVKVVKQFKDDIEADNLFNAFFLEEPKERKKYRLPTVALALCCYDKDISSWGEINKSPLYKKMSKSKKIVRFRNWFRAIDPDGVKCWMHIWVDAEYAKDTGNDWLYESKVVMKDNEYFVLSEVTEDRVVLMNERKSKVVNLEDLLHLELL